MLINDSELDEEWIVLIKQAKMLGLNIEEIQLFLKEAKKLSAPNLQE